MIGITRQNPKSSLRMATVFLQTLQVVNLEIHFQNLIDALCLNLLLQEPCQLPKAGKSTG
jgi:hypothetical protein